ncbi:MAG: hypothetical protein ACR2LL_10370 [Nitrosopumilus sp.]
MKYLIWQNNNENDTDDCLCKNNGKILNVLLTNRSFAEIFEGDNPLYPVDQIIKMHQKKSRITKFEKADDVIEVGVVSVSAATAA